MVAHLVDVVDGAIIFNVVSGDIIFDVVYGDNVVDVVYGGNVVDVVYGGNIVDVVIAHTSLSRKILQDFTFHVKKGFAIRDLRGAVKVLLANFGTMKQKEKGIKKLITSFPNVAPFFSPKVMFMKCATVSQLRLSLSLSLSLSTNQWHLGGYFQQFQNQVPYYFLLCQGKYHSSADLILDWFEFNRTSKSVDDLTNKT